MLGSTTEAAPAVCSDIILCVRDFNEHFPFCQPVCVYGLFHIFFCGSVESEVGCVWMPLCHYAKSGRSSCHACTRKIGEVRTLSISLSLSLNLSLSFSLPQSLFLSFSLNLSPSLSLNLSLPINPSPSAGHGPLEVYRLQRQRRRLRRDAVVSSGLLQAQSSREHQPVLRT